MNKVYFFLCCIVLLLPPCTGAESRLRPSDWAVPVISRHLKNWYKVDSVVYRSEQPDARAMSDIEGYGIRRVLNLREFHSDDDEIKHTKLKSFRVPINAAKIKDKDVIKALKIIRLSKDPILIHCWHGSDRTGVIVAMYRIVEQGWTKASAIDELKNGGYGYHSIYKNIITYIDNVDVTAIKNQLKSRQP